MAQNDYNWLESYLPPSGAIHDHHGPPDGPPRPPTERSASPYFRPPSVSQPQTQYASPYAHAPPVGYMNFGNNPQYQAPHIAQSYHQGSLYRLSPYYNPSGAQPAAQPPSVPLPQRASQPPLPQDAPPNNLPLARKVVQYSPHPFAMGPGSRDTAIEGPQAKRPRIQDASASKLPAPNLPSAGLSSFTFTPPDTSDKSFLKSRSDIVKPFKETDAMKKTTYNPATIARDVLIAAGRHPTQRPLNYHLLRLRDVFDAVDLTSDLASFRWDLVDPDESTPAPTTLDRVAKSRDDNEMRSPDPRPAPAPTPAPPAPLPAVNNQHHNHNYQHPLPPAPQAHVPAPIPHRDIQPPSRQNTTQETPKSTPRPRSQPPGHTNSPAARPKMVGKRPPGRPPKSAKPPMVQKPVEPPVPYPVYRCHWQNCYAELHNLEMLKKHIGRAHIPHTLVCKWKDCTVTQNMPAVELLRHVKKTHIEPIAWKLGDGPSVPRTVDDPAGNPPVPPTIPDLNQPGGEDLLIFPTSDSSIRAFNKVHGKHSQREKAMEIMKAVQRMKEHVGFGLDPGGCQLATPARNERVSNEESFYEVRSE